MSKIQVVEHISTVMKVAGAMLLGAAVVPVAAFSALLAGCSMSALSALRIGDRGAVIVNASFVVANALGLARSVGLLG
jgi:hypothetical protein